MTGLPRDIAALVGASGGVIDTVPARRAGVSESRLRDLSRKGRLTRLARGIYAPAATADAMDEWTRFRQVSRAFAQATDTYVTGWAAVVERKLPTLGRPPSAPTTIRPRAADGHHSRSGRGRIIVVDLPEVHRRRKGPLLLASLPWATVDLGRTARLPDVLVVADEAARRGAELAAVLPHMSRWAGIDRTRWVVEHADPCAESPLETLGRFAFLEYDMPMPVSNAWVGRDGPERRVDGLLPWHWWAIEGDGALKYDSRPDASEIVRAQYDREFRLRRDGLDFLRYGWPDVFPSRAPFVDKARAMFSDHPVREIPVRWWKDVPGGMPVEPSPDDWPSPYPAGVVLPAGWQHEMDGLRDPGC